MSGTTPASSVGSAIKRVLVVEDKRSVQMIISMILGSRGITEIEAVTSGAEAIRKLNGKKGYDLVLCERFMLPINGLDLKLLMNSKPEWAEIPFICMLSADRPGDAAKRETALIHHCIAKPFTAETLLACVDAATRTRAAA